MYVPLFPLKPVLFFFFFYCRFRDENRKGYAIHVFNQLVHCAEVGLEPVRFRTGVQPLTHYTILPFIKDVCSIVVKNKLKAH